MSRIYEYLAEKIMEDLRSKQSVDDKLLKELTSCPPMDYIRLKANNDDIALILSLANAGSKALRSFAIALLRKVKDDERVKSFIRDAWKKAWEKTGADRDNLLIMDLMWRLLDDPCLDILEHRKIYGFIKENWKYWIEDVTHSYGGENNILDSVKERLARRDTLETKKWIYLCVSMASPDITGVKMLLSEYENSDNHFVSEIVAYLQTRLST